MSDASAEVEEAVIPKVRKVGPKPSEEEPRRHNVTHLPFRNWCKVCVAGRAKDWPHVARPTSSIPGIPEVHFDYCFPREAVGSESVVVLVGRSATARPW